MRFPTMSRLGRYGALAVLTTIATVGPAGVAHADQSGARQRAFDGAAARYGVPESVLLGVSYLESRWEAHRGQASSAGGYGPMNLTDAAGLTARALSGTDGEDARGDTRRPEVSAPAAPMGPQADRPDLRTLATAAGLTGAKADALRSDDAANIAGGAALLASYQRELHHPVSGNAADWYAAVARYGAGGGDTGTDLADEVFDLIRGGMSRTTDDGQRIALAAAPGLRPAAGQRPGAAAGTPAPECPASLGCDFIPAAYKQDGPTKADYGNYDTAHRPSDMPVRYIVIHDQEGYYNGSVSWFQNPAARAAANYVMRAADGHITQMVSGSNVVWHAGNWYVNQHSVGIEHEGFAATGATWYTEISYRRSARLVQWLAARYGIPTDRQHIIGHGNVPGTTTPNIKAMHWDPGPFWDWNHYMDLIHGTDRTAAAARPDLTHAGMVTIDPYFSTNQQPVTGCDKEGSGKPCAAQGSNFVYLRTAPSDTAPLLSDTGLHPGPATQDIADWAARAEAGQQFALAGRQGDWTAVWYLGQRGWFRNSPDAPTAHRAAGLVVTPRKGLSSIPVYGRAYPEASAYAGSPVPVQAVTPYDYGIAAGQSYVLGEVRGPTDYYYAENIDSSAPGDHTVTKGKDRYLEIQFGHRIAFVRAADVTVHPAVG